jgi:hypothetical protein
VATEADGRAFGQRVAEQLLADGAATLLARRPPAEPR